MLVTSNASAASILTDTKAEHHALSNREQTQQCFDPAAAGSHFRGVFHASILVVECFRLLSSLCLNLVAI